MLDSVTCIFYYSEAIEFTDKINHNFSLLRNFTGLIDVNCIAIAYIKFILNFMLQPICKERKKIIY